MASRYLGDTASAVAALNPNTQSSTEQSSSSQIQSSSSSSYQGLTPTGLADTQQVIDKLLYGSNPKKEVVYTGSNGVIYDKAFFIARYGAADGEGVWNNFLRYVTAQNPLRPEEFTDVGNFTGSNGKLTKSTRITPSADSVLNGNPDRASALTSLRNILGNYDPANASADSQAAVNYAIQKAMESNMPAIQRSIENAGTSGGSMGALLSQDLAARTGGEAAQLALKTKVDYGQISANTASTLANLVSQKDPALQQLLDAIGLTTSSRQSQSSSGVSTQSGTQSSTPLGISNPELFPTSTPAPNNNNNNSTSDYSYTDTPAYSSSPSSSGGSSSGGSGFILNNTTGNLTTFGSTNADEARRRLLQAS